LGKNPYTDKQLIMNAICLLLSTGLYTRAFEDWDQLNEATKTWIELCQIIQDAFQQRLNASAPTSGHQGYAPALPFQQNAFNALAADDSDEDTADTMATQMAALTYQSQLTAATAANASERMDQYVHTLAQYNKNNYNKHSSNSWFNLQPSHSTTARVEELGDRDAPIFPHHPPLHQPSWDATIMDTVGDKDAEEAVDHSFSRGAIHPPDVYQCR
jgi:hypothetical protein